MAFFNILVLILFLNINFRWLGRCDNISNKRSRFATNPYLQTPHKSFNKSTPCNILVLSGGGAHGVFQVGVLKYLNEINRMWNIITGVSVGSLNALILSMYSSKNQTEAINHMKDLWLNLNNSQIYTHYWNPFKHQSLYDNSPLNHTIYTNIIKFGTTIKRDIIIGATSINNGQLVLFTKNDMRGAINITNIIMGSIAIPIYFPPKYFSNEYFADGGVFSNEIVSPAIRACRASGSRNITIDVILCSEPINKITNDEIRNFTIFDITYRAYKLVTNALFNHELYTNCDPLSESYPMNIYKPNEKYQGGILDFDPQILKKTYNVGYKTKKPYKTKYCN
jgi:predicted patatin/cPLA2 family phospholipase